MLEGADMDEKLKKIIIQNAEFAAVQQLGGIIVEVAEVFEREGIELTFALIPDINKEFAQALRQFARANTVIDGMYVISVALNGNLVIFKGTKRDAETIKYYIERFWKGNDPTASLKALESKIMSEENRLQHQIMFMLLGISDPTK